MRSHPPPAPAAPTRLAASSITPPAAAAAAAALALLLLHHPTAAGAFSVGRGPSGSGSGSAATSAARPGKKSSPLLPPFLPSLRAAGTGPTDAERIASFLGGGEGEEEEEEDGDGPLAARTAVGGGGGGGTDAHDYSFFDEASIYVRAGSGGQGSSTYKKAKKGANGVPDGGSGGTGGDVVLEVDAGLNTLAGLGSARPGGRLLSYRAGDGTHGGRTFDNGRGGEDCHVRVPPGTVVSLELERVAATGGGTEGDAKDAGDADADAEAEADSDSDSEEEPEPGYDLVELGAVTSSSPTLVVARGGRGGEGTGVLKGRKKGAKRRGPEGGERSRLRLTLKIVADVALVGVPNAGKSTFLASVTRATPRIADYPFTTVVPNLGTWIPPGEGGRGGGGGGGGRGGGRCGGRGGGTSSDGDRADRAAGSTGLVLCDVPGLIAGASEGVGLGHAFLRHIERCRIILHLVDATAEDPVADLTMVNDELARYGTGRLAAMPQVVVVNKIDAAFGGDRGDGQDDDEEEEAATRKREELGKRLREAMGHTRLMWMSAKERDGVDDLMARMAPYVGKIKEDAVADAANAANTANAGPEA